MMTAPPSNNLIMVSEEEAEKQPQHFIFREGEEVVCKGVRFTVSLIEPPRIVLKAVERVKL